MDIGQHRIITLILVFLFQLLLKMHLDRGELTNREFDINFRKQKIAVTEERTIRIN